MSEPRIVTPEEAQAMFAGDFVSPDPDVFDLAHTVATEPDRTRSAVVKALRQMQSEAFNKWSVKPYVDEWVKARADAIENGAPFDA
jgi:hypothetical protein